MVTAYAFITKQIDAVDELLEQRELLEELTGKSGRHQHGRRLYYRESSCRSGAGASRDHQDSLFSCRQGQLFMGRQVFGAELGYPNEEFFGASLFRK